jgi:hypothetical protein
MSITLNAVVGSAATWPEDPGGIGLCWGKVSGELEFERLAI